MYLTCMSPISLFPLCFCIYILSLYAISKMAKEFVKRKFLDHTIQMSWLGLEHLNNAIQQKSPAQIDELHQFGVALLQGLNCTHVLGKSYFIRYRICVLLLSSLFTIYIYYFIFFPKRIIAVLSSFFY